MLAFSSNVPSSNLSEVYSVFCKQNCLKRTEINPKIANNVSLGLLTDWLSSLRHCFKGNFHHIHQALIPRNRKSFCDRKDELLEKQIIKDNGTKNGGKQAYQIWTSRLMNMTFVVTTFTATLFSTVNSKCVHLKFCQWMDSKQRNRQLCKPSHSHSLDFLKSHFAP